ncbi:TetR/AcrR family transcriptional regulator [Paracoccus mutanolyticus]|nr:helix-turn-helix domain-containing protein [Paracoccus mutanolyticus]
MAKAAQITGFGQILDSAELHFAEHGFSGASLRDMAADAGVNQALIRYYFGSKRPCSRRWPSLRAGQ